MTPPGFGRYEEERTSEKVGEYREEKNETDKRDKRKRDTDKGNLYGFGVGESCAVSYLVDTTSPNPSQFVAW